MSVLRIYLKLISIKAVTDQHAVPLFDRNYISVTSNAANEFLQVQITLNVPPNILARPIGDSPDNIINSVHVVLSTEPIDKSYPNFVDLNHIKSSKILKIEQNYASAKAHLSADISNSYKDTIYIRVFFATKHNWYGNTTQILHKFERKYCILLDIRIELFSLTKSYKRQRVRDFL